MDLTQELYEALKFEMSGYTPSSVSPTSREALARYEREVGKPFYGGGRSGKSALNPKQCPTCEREYGVRQGPSGNLCSYIDSGPSASHTFRCPDDWHIFRSPGQPPKVC